MADISSGRVLVVDDEPNALKVLSSILFEEGYAVSQAPNASEALDKVRSQDFDAVITDMKMPGRDGMQLYDDLNTQFPDIPVIFLTAYGTVESAVRAMNRGAFYYFIKPPDYMSLKGTLARAVEERRMKRTLGEGRCSENGCKILGNNPGLKKILAQVHAVRDSSSSVLVRGETGTGKELIARALHYGSIRQGHPFVAVNCAAIPSELIEAELFGHEKGAFTGAVGRRVGRVEQAAGGTLFLDEIGELKPAVQAKLLRVIQEKEVQRLGSNHTVAVEFRLVSSTNRNLVKDVAKGTFREDLYYRINVVEFEVPPLRERREDIPLLVHAFLEEFCAREHKVLFFGDEVMNQLCRFPWPGNIRQLRNVVERAVVLSRGKTMTLRDLPGELTDFDRHGSGTGEQPTLKELEVRTIRDVLRSCDGNKSQAAKILGFSRKALYKRLKDFPLH
ncbi:chemotaxis protein CheY [Desulfuromonas soudanensis]|uniref:Chemotaxis protein CheY n=1 Tax=Desulfuromonas soudanensis TaxID=1603606 RepID=A0A0M4DIS8_9BACT|nr:sigma-54 dependent transcriptional regulator [Desulfuromonas soudanensis]ALC16882.1 chemotaxis protein CheY [Desulfuromonas soudanensis]